MSDNEITVRDLSRNAAEVLARVSKGESLVVTMRSKPVATLMPFGAGPKVHEVARQTPAANLLAATTPARPSSTRALTHARYDTPEARELLRKLRG